MNGHSRSRANLSEAADERTPAIDAPAPELSVVVPSWRGAALLARVLPSLIADVARTGLCAEILVVDDASDRDAGAEVVAQLGAPLRFLPAPAHAGFAATANHGAAAARGSLLALWNNDMEPEPGCLATLLAALGDETFAVVPRIEIPDGRAESATRLRWVDATLHAHSLDTPSTATAPRPVAWPCGGAMLCRRERFLALEGFSTGFAPFYWEDVDLGWRAWQRGWASIEIPTARARHGYKATIAAHFDEAEVERVFARNRLRFTLMHTHGLLRVRALLAHFARRMRGCDETFPRRLSFGDRRRSPLSSVVKAGPDGWPDG
jgi:GT2 family glycosyltransferase